MKLIRKHGINYHVSEPRRPNFSFYDWVTYLLDNAGLGEAPLGRWIGVLHRIGPLMSYWIVTDTGEQVSRMTVQRVTSLELSTDACNEGKDNKV